MSIGRYSQENSRNGLAPFGTLTNTTFNGGKGSGNFGHAGREGKVGGSAPSGSSHGETSEKDSSEYKGRFDPDDLGNSPLMIVKDGDNHKMKTMGNEAASRMLLGISDELSKVGNLPYDKTIKKAAETKQLSKQHQAVGQQISGIGSILRAKANEMGDAMTFVDKDFDYDDFDRQMEHAAEFLIKAKIGLIGDSSTIGKKLSDAIDTLERLKTNLQGIADPDLIKARKEPEWVDIEDMIKK